MACYYTYVCSHSTFLYVFTNSELLIARQKIIWYSYNNNVSYYPA